MLWFGALVILAIAVAIWWASPPEPVAALRRHQAGAARVERLATPELGARVERWRVTTANGDTATGLWRPAAAGARPWTVVLLGGLVTGDRAALLLPPDAPVHVLAMDWPWSRKRRLPAWEFVARLPAIQAAVLRSPAVLVLGVEAAARQPEVDPERIALLGASLGAPPAVAAVRLTDAPSALILIDGAADLESVLRDGLGRQGWPDLVAAPAAALGFRLVRPLEPSLHARTAGRLRVLIMNGTHDQLIPRRAVDVLHESFPEAEIRWRPGLHLHPDRLEAIAETAKEVEAWLDPPGPVAAREGEAPADE